MTYTFWHCDVLMGESALAHKSQSPAQRADLFFPTEYGLTLMPRVTCALTAGHALLRDLEALGKSAAEMSAEEAEIFVKSRACGLAMLDVGRVLSKVEVRGADGNRLEYESIAFCDVEEFYRFGRVLGVDYGKMLAKLPPDTRPVTVSVTLRKTSPRASRTIKRLFRRNRLR